MEDVVKQLSGNRYFKENDMDINLAKEIISSIPSLYNLKDYEEEAILLILKNVKESKFITKYKVNKNDKEHWFRQ